MEVPPLLISSDKYHLYFREERTTLSQEEQQEEHQGGHREEDGRIISRIEFHPIFFDRKPHTYRDIIIKFYGSVNPAPVKGYLVTIRYTENTAEETTYGRWLPFGIFVSQELAFYWRNRLETEDIVTILPHWNEANYYLEEAVVEEVPIQRPLPQQFSGDPGQNSEKNSLVNSK